MLNLLNNVKITKLTQLIFSTVGIFLMFWLEGGIYDLYYLYFVVSELLLTLDFLSVILEGAQPFSFIYPFFYWYLVALY